MVFCSLVLAPFLLHITIVVSVLEIAYSFKILGDNPETYLGLTQFKPKL